MAIDLKPCPFCGHADPSVERMGNSRVSTQYECGMCGCRLETGEEWNHGSDWNRRPIEDAKDAEISRLLSERDTLREALDPLGALALGYPESIVLAMVPVPISLLRRASAAISAVEPAAKCERCAGTGEDPIDSDGEGCPPVSCADCVGTGRAAGTGEAPASQVAAGAPEPTHTFYEAVNRAMQMVELTGEAQSGEVES